MGFAFPSCEWNCTFLVHDKWLRQRVAMLLIESRLSFVANQSAKRNKNSVSPLNLHLSTTTHKSFPFCGYSRRLRWSSPSRRTPPQSAAASIKANNHSSHWKQNLPTLPYIFTVSSHSLSTSVGLLPRRSQVISSLPPFELAGCSQVGLCKEIVEWKW